MVITGRPGKFGIASTNLPGRSGAIQAVLNLEIPSPHVEYVNIVIGKFIQHFLRKSVSCYTEGVNGVLPNLDLVNVVVYLCHSEKLNVAFQSMVKGWLSILSCTTAFSL